MKCGRTLNSLQTTSTTCYCIASENRKSRESNEKSLKVETADLVFAIHFFECDKHYMGKTLNDK
jgi:hypothetical protein